MDRGRGCHWRSRFRYEGCEDRDSSLNPNKLAFHIRPAQQDDAEGLLRIYGPIVAETSISFEEQVPTVEDMRLRLHEGLREYPWLVAIDEAEQVIGYTYACSWRKRRAYRWSCEVSAYIHPDHQRQGLGLALYASLFEILKQRGFVVAYAGVTLPNPDSVRFHEAYGFEAVGIFPDCGFKFGRWHGVGFWRLELAERSSNPSLKSTS